jgi:hypothetical protein
MCYYGMYPDGSLCADLDDPECVPFDDNCHERELCPDYYDDGEINDSAPCLDSSPAGSSKACHDANKSRCTIPFGMCMDDYCEE